MKFTNLFTLLVASSALAYNVPMKRDEFQDEAQKIGQAYDAANFDQIAGDLENGKLPTNTDTLTTGNLSTGNQAADNSQVNTDPMSSFNSLTSPECMTFLQEINSKCPVEKNDDKDKSCKIFNSEECKAAFKKDLSSCGDINSLLGLSFNLLKMTCGVDENGKYCPLSTALESKEEPDYDALAQETCKSKACTDNALENLPELKKLRMGSNTVNVVKIDNLIASLKEEKCTAAHSGASHIKVGSALLFTLALVLSYF